ncbi:hypothetical protein CRG98_002304 [Punica granatum]|uniref:Uncharacterized protein n=1 Tax=Punica granatum TaxID=22663 RepID=A0A2I0L9J4_PUNGR|nr:hypothetical protein CRG98_002304 [Punica granatum]
MEKEQRCIYPSEPSSAPAPAPITAFPSVTALTAPPPAVTTTCTGWREGGSGHSWLEVGERGRDRGRRRRRRSRPGAAIAEPWSWLQTKNPAALLSSPLKARPLTGGTPRVCMKCCCSSPHKASTAMDAVN